MSKRLEDLAWMVSHVEQWELAVDNCLTGGTSTGENFREVARQYELPDADPTPDLAAAVQLWSERIRNILRQITERVRGEEGSA